LTDKIFENVWSGNAEADADPYTLRVSIDTKAVVYIGPYSRRGKSRCLKAIEAADHDMDVKTKLVPGGILEVKTGRSFLFFTDNFKTSDFIVDGIDCWWISVASMYTSIKRLVINMDNGPECNGRRTRFLQRLVEFVDTYKIIVRLIYYPPYHSKYNKIEHFWGGLERSWNGYLLESIDEVINRALNFAWRGINPKAVLFDTIYETGVTLSIEERVALEKRLIRSENLPWYDITITPLMVN
jgi:hypothetical protein